MNEFIAGFITVGMLIGAFAADGVLTYPIGFAIITTVIVRAVIHTMVSAITGKEG